MYPVNTGAQSPEIGAQEYEASFRAKEGEPAIFDLVLLGVGEDGHTASIFPDSPLFGLKDRVFSGSVGPTGKGDRVTITPAAIISARKILFIVRGDGKADVMGKIGSGTYDSKAIPALISESCTGKVTWFVDSEAAQRLPK